MTQFASHLTRVKPGSRVTACDRHSRGDRRADCGEPAQQQSGPKHHLMICFVATASLIAIARISGLSWEDLGLARDTWRPGVLVGRGVWCGGVVYAIAASLPLTRKGFSDKRAAEQGWTSVLYESTIRIPFRQPRAAEETAFRLGAACCCRLRRLGLDLGVVSSIVFGFCMYCQHLEFHETTKPPPECLGTVARTSDERHLDRSRHRRCRRRLRVCARTQRQPARRSLCTRR